MLNEDELKSEEEIKKELEEKAKNFSPVQNNNLDDEVTGNCDLPSQGKGYLEDNPFSSGVATISALKGIDEEKIISLKNDNNIIRSFYNLIGSKIKNGNIYNLYSNDFPIILFFLKTFSYQDEEFNKYSFRSFCDKCSSQVNFEDIDINEIEFKEWEGDIPFVFTLDKDNIQITFKPLTIGEEIEVSKQVEKDKKNVVFKNLDTIRLRLWEAMTVKLVQNGNELNKNDYFSFYLNMPLKTKAEFKKKITDFELFGNGFYHSTCPNCGAENDFLVTINYSKLFEMS